MVIIFFCQKNTRNFQPQSLAKWIASVTKDIYATGAVRVRAFLGSFARASWSWEGHAFSERIQRGVGKERGRTRFKKIEIETNQIYESI